MLPIPTPRLRSILALGSLALVSGCGSSSGDDSNLVVASTPHTASSTAAIAVDGLWMVYLASEPFTGAGTDLNGDTDTNDEVAVAVDMSTGTATELRAAKRAVLLGGEVYLVVSEADDDFDWNPVIGKTDTVLLHWSAASGTVTFVDTLDPAGAQRPFVIGTGLFYRSNAIPAAGDESSLRRIDATDPTTPVAIAGAVGLGLSDPEILGVDENLLFLALDETTAGTDHNGDADTVDTHVLALIDGTNPAPLIRNTGLALADSAAPFDAFLVSTGNWLVGCLVGEAPLGADGQSRTGGLNDQGNGFIHPLVPCATNDVDTADQVLFFLTFSGTPAVPGTPVNTGIAGHLRVLAFTGFVATISSEADSNCDLNGDGDGQLDDVPRWCPATAPAAPVVTVGLMHAIETAVPGGSFGLSRLGNRLVAVIDEADDEQNLDGKGPPGHDLVAWIEPALATPVWHFAHQSGSTRSFGTGIFDSDGDSEPFAGTSWMAPDPVGDRLGVTFLEEVPGTNANVGSLNTNLNCNVVAKDGDKTDALPVWADFESGPVLDFDGVGYAVVKGNAGIVIAGGFAFFRVSEVDDNRDYDGDSVLDDVVLFRNPLTSCGPVAMATASALNGPVIATDSERGAAFLSIEGGALVVKYFLF